MNSQTTRSRKTLVVLLAAFILPVVVAKVVLSFDLYQGGATNQGQLLKNGISYQTLTMDNPAPRHWQLVYLLPSQCEQQCQSRLYILNQSYIALGRERDRVMPIIATTENSDISALANLNVAFTTTTSSPALTKLLAKQQMLIVDPLGAMVMEYQAVEGQQQNMALGKAMIADLRKMLKLSRVG
ncbi:hypothetical protein ACFOD0_10980 [Shewanella intestini]|uniref:Cytochrome oxidase assembly protein n=1 Tax=Shewanella intestini TaxID=2017544 RepID=A0ABS5I2G5_9GAMM|nr:MULTISPECIES: hypothetical protein [Shewanella]MBR9728076.1 hypothetical protein [Shewanella intestini]MRG36548.1 hypothetical protein [Shewanella sp. XMDDZSB0408]